MRTAFGRVLDGMKVAHESWQVLEISPEAVNFFDRFVDGEARTYVDRTGDLWDSRKPCKTSDTSCGGEGCAGPGFAGCAEDSECRAGADGSPRPDRPHSLG